MIVLLDIDGTLIRCGGAGRRALNHAFEAQLGVVDAMRGVRFAGSTDQRIVEDSFVARFGRKPTDSDDISRLLDGYLTRLDAELNSPCNGYEVLAGATKLAEALDAAEHVVAGLATGNLERGARIKLEPAGLNRYFGFGGFGCDAMDRTALVRRGIERGQTRATQTLGRTVPGDQIFVIGDTGYDVSAAHAAGAQAIGVRVGSFHPEELENSGANLIIDTLEEPALWSLLGLGDPAQ